MSSGPLPSPLTGCDKTKELNITGERDRAVMKDGKEKMKNDCKMCIRVEKELGIGVDVCRVGYFARGFVVYCVGSRGG